MADHLGAGGGSVAMSTHLRTTFGPRYLAIDVLVGLGPSRAQAAEQPSISIIVVSFQGPLQQHGNPPLREHGHADRFPFKLTFSV